MSPASSLLLAVLLLLGNAFFVGAEFAVISARRSQVEPLAEAGRRGARTALWAMEHVSLMLAAAQLGITVCSLGLGAVAEPAVAHLLHGPFEAVRLPEAAVHPVSFGIALAIVVYLHVVVGEMIPKNLALAAPERSALILAPALVVCARATSWLIGSLRAVTDALLRAVHVEPKEELASAFTAEEVYAIVTESRREGLIAQDSTLLTGALELSQRNAVDVMVPWDRVVTVLAGSSPQEVERLVGRTGYSRFPVVPHAGSRDLVGYLHLKDLLYADDERYTEPVPSGRVRALVSVDARADIEDVLAALQRSGAHLARVIEDAPEPSIETAEEGPAAAGAALVDGGQSAGQSAGHSPRTVGVVFLEDVLEELVGEVRDATQRSGALLEAARMSHPT